MKTYAENRNFFADLIIFVYSGDMNTKHLWNGQKLVGCWMVKILNGFPKPNSHSKSDQIAAILDSYVLVPFLNGLDYSCSYGPNHSNTKPFQIPTLKCLDFKKVLNLNALYFVFSASYTHLTVFVSLLKYLFLNVNGSNFEHSKT